MSMLFFDIKLSDDTSYISNERTWNFATFDNMIVL